MQRMQAGVGMGDQVFAVAEHEVELASFRQLPNDRFDRLDEPARGQVGTAAARGYGIKQQAERFLGIGLANRIEPARRRARIAALTRQFAVVRENPRAPRKLPLERVGVGGGATDP